MSPSLALLFTGLLAAQPADAPKLSPGQELIYRGSYSETASHDAAQFRRAFELEILTYVRDVRRGELDVAFFTSLKSPKSEIGEAARLELATVDARGRVRLTSGRPRPLCVDGPPALECAGFIEIPAGAPPQWSTSDDPRPAATWKMDGLAEVNGVRCRRLTGSRQSPDWDRRSSDRPAWLCRETVWIGHDDGIVRRLERDLEWRSVGQRDTMLRSRTEYVLHGGVSTYPGSLGDDRRNETQQADRFQQELRKLQELGARARPETYAGLVGRIDRFLATKPATPYRPAIETLRQRAEAGRRGEPPPPESP